jgi:hypothetical protein
VNDTGHFLRSGENFAGYLPLFVMMGGFHLIAWIVVHIHLGDMRKPTNRALPAA